MIKRNVLCIMCLCILLCLMLSSANASSHENNQQFGSCKKLSNKDIIKVLRQTKYASWDIYQPTDSEIEGRDIYKEDWFKSTAWFPVIAHQDNEVELVLLHRTDNKWSVELSSRSALTSNDYYLVAFTVIENSYETTGNALFGFNFRSALYPADQGYQYDLYLKVGDENYFSDFFYRNPMMRYFSSIYGVSLHIDKAENTATYSSMASPDGYSLVSIEYIFQNYSIDTGVEYFDLSTFPISIEHLFTQKQVFSNNGDTLVYSESDTNSSVLCTIPASENVYCYPYGSNWWLVIYNDKIGFVQQ